MYVTLECNRKMDEDTAPNFTDAGSDECLLKLALSSKKACPIFSLTYLYQQNPLYFSLAFMVAGLFIAFVGIRLYKTVLFLLAAFLIGFLLLVIIYQMILPRYVEEWAFWVCLGISALVGLTMGGIVVAYDQQCFVLAGACLGGVASFILYGAFLSGTAGPVLSLGVVHTPT